MQKILLESSSEQEKYKTYAAGRRHVLTPEEMKYGRLLLSKGISGQLSPKEQIKKEGLEEAERKKELSEPQESKYSNLRYKVIKSPKNVGISYPKAKKIQTKEQYKRIETPKKSFPIVDPVFGIPRYIKPKKQPELQSKQIENFARENFTLEKPKPKPTERLIKPVQKEEHIQKPLIRAPAPDFFGGMFETPKPEIKEKKIIRKKKHIVKKFKIVKKHYRRYPKRCKR